MTATFRNSTIELRAEASIGGASDVEARRMPRVDIDRGALRRNWRRLADRHSSARTGAAIKANGYGLGACEVSRALFAAGCRDFFVAWPSEGRTVRRSLSDIAGSKARIFVLQGLEPSAVEPCLTDDLVPVLSSLDDLRIWSTGLARLGRSASCALQFETGMNRLGLDERDLGEAARIAAAAGSPIALVLSHLANADESIADSQIQRRRFFRMAAQFPGVPRSLANSAGLFLGDEFAFDLARPGIALYGGRAGVPEDVTIEPVARLTAAVLQVRETEAGERAGYGRAAQLSRRTRIATVGIGYGDGYPRALSGSGTLSRPDSPAPVAFLAGRRVPILGRISMDLTLLDITDVPENAVLPGDRAEFFGPNVPIDDVARAAGTIAYELLTGLGARVYRSWSEGPI
ncbi:alanine racemase [Fulvimarina sp. 2208YS6-2-32]|uniref:Alanine racemase n=1 Tax=Fulvimarina uroteuthidis TaxID=3098149 RepID=A0ABU5I4Z4_9HYPH|nr:alanine racemase [Fulvimarina sp. 2208YS6-2-32]MDY8110449.1 alanine racemase [Fulvimarina sp. 2208YS6-2-32]